MTKTSLHPRRACVVAFVMSCVVGVGGCGRARPAREAPPPPPGRGSVFQRGEISAGVHHTCAIRARGEVFCWGQNEWGQVGDGSARTRPTPRRVQGIEGATSVVAGPFHTCAIVAEHRVKCWGGDRNEDEHGLIPRDVPIDTPIESLAAVNSLTCAIDVNRKVWCWGMHGGPALVPALEGARLLATTEGHVCAIVRKGVVGCFDEDEMARDQLGPEDRVDFIPRIGDAVDLALSGGVGCALTVAGKVKCWQLDRDREIGPRPATVEMRGLEGVLEIFAATDEICAVRSHGSVHCFGVGEAALLARHDEAVTSLRDASYLSRYRAIAMGKAHGCGVDDQGDAWCWGSDEDTLGTGSDYSTSIRASAVDHSNDIVGMASGDAFSCVLRFDGLVRCWGSKKGFGKPDDDRAPRVIEGIEHAIALYAGPRFACVVELQGGTKCWGDLAHSPSSPAVDPSHPSGFRPPTLVESSLDLPDGIPLPEPCVILGSGQVDCRGTSDAPRKPSAAGWVFARAAKWLAPPCFIDSNNDVYCWGDNDHGQLGDGTRQPRRVARKVRGLGGATQISAGQGHVCVLAQATVYCWGRNDRGQVGDGTRTDRVKPVRILEPGSVRSISAGPNFTCAAVTDGSLRCWGANDLGALGFSAGFDRLTPVDGPGIYGSIEVTAGKGHGCGRSQSGGLACWGGNPLHPPPPPVALRSPRRVAMP